MGLKQKPILNGFFDTRSVELRTHSTVPTDLVKISVKEATHMGFYYSIIHTHQFKIRQKKLRNLFTPSAIFLVTKFHVFVIMSKATSEVFSSYQRNRTVPSFRERYRLTVLYQTNCGYDGTERGFSKCDLIATKRTKLFFYFI